MAESEQSNNHNVQLALIAQKLEALTQEHNTFRMQVHQEMTQFRDQTHEWLQVMVNKLPTWAVAVGGLMTTALGYMAAWILTHK